MDGNLIDPSAVGENRCTCAPPRIRLYLFRFVFFCFFFGRGLQRVFFHNFNYTCGFRKNLIKRIFYFSRVMRNKSAPRSLIGRAFPLGEFVFFPSRLKIVLMSTLKIIPVLCCGYFSACVVYCNFRSLILHIRIQLVE